jgi:hypothetical protein
MQCLSEDVKLTPAEITNRIKAALRKQFPQCTFSVMGEFIRWTDDGPTKTEVEDAVIATGLVEISHSDGKRYLRHPGKFGIFFDRYNEAERAAFQQDLERRQTESRQRRQEEDERVAEAKRAARSLWDAQDIPSIPLLAQLNAWVIKQNEKRLPKWKFRLADDLAVQIHSRVTRAYELLFECVALQADNLSVKLFLEPKRLRGQRYRRIGFELSADVPDAATWTFKPTAYREPGWSQSSLIAFRQRVVTALHPDHFASLRPDLMLSAHCLCCGKALTDPVSMARWIGPECWGSASTNLPRIFKTNGALRISATEAAP